MDGVGVGGDRLALLSVDANLCIALVQTAVLWSAFATGRPPEECR